MFVQRVIRGYMQAECNKHTSTMNQTSWRLLSQPAARATWLRASTKHMGVDDRARAAAIMDYHGAHAATAADCLKQQVLLSHRFLKPLRKRRRARGCDAALDVGAAAQHTHAAVYAPR